MTAATLAALLLSTASDGSFEFRRIADISYSPALALPRLAEQGIDFTAFSPLELDVSILEYDGSADSWLGGRAALGWRFALRHSRDSLGKGSSLDAIASLGATTLQWGAGDCSFLNPASGNDGASTHSQQFGEARLAIEGVLWVARHLGVGLRVSAGLLVSFRDQFSCVAGPGQQSPPFVATQPTPSPVLRASAQISF